MDVQPLRSSVVVVAPVPKLLLQARYRSPSGGSLGYLAVQPLWGILLGGAYRMLFFGAYRTSRTGRALGECGGQVLFFRMPIGRVGQTIFLKFGERLFDPVLLGRGSVENDIFGSFAVREAVENIDYLENKFWVVA